MKKLFTVLLFTAMNLVATAQKIDTLRQKILNQCVLLMNETVQQSDTLLRKLKYNYSNLQAYQAGSAAQLQPFSARILASNPAQRIFKDNLPADMELLGREMKEFYDITYAMQQTCNRLESYVAKSEYAKDKQFLTHAKLMKEFQAQFVYFRNQKEECKQQIIQIYRFQQPLNTNNLFHKEEDLMTKILEKEKNLLRSWNYDFNDHIHSGWLLNMLERNIKEVDTLITELKKNNLKLPKPGKAGGIFGSFLDMMETIQMAKRNALLDYN
ncbi:MAG: hypothetical protein H7Y04_08760, partial [Verrucomicrobia bacterium]|nr:hypothetical protein [Cytophagales bacterium]